MQGHTVVPGKRLKCAANGLCFDKKYIKCLVDVAVGFRLHNAGAPRLNPEFISVPQQKRLNSDRIGLTRHWINSSVFFKPL